MTRGQLWIEVRYRLVVLGIGALLVAALWLAAGRSIHFGPPSRYDPPVVVTYEVEIVSWHEGSALVGGWVTSETFADCADVVLRFEDGPQGYIAIGPVPAHGHVMFLADARTRDGRPLRMAARPRLTGACQLPSP